MADNLVSIPQITETIPQDFIIEALGGPEVPSAILDRFPDDLYHKAPESHLFHLIYAIFGPVGLGRIRQEYLKARLQLEEMGIELFDLDGFFADPMSLGRLLEESYDYDGDPTDRALRDQILARDAAYRNRAIDFLSGVRLGNSPQGMRLVAKGGLGYDVEIIENYKYLYDLRSDRPIGYRYFGSTDLLGEMIVVPRQELSVSEVQSIEVVGSPSGGTFVLAFNGQSTVSLAYNCPAVTTWDRTDPTAPVVSVQGVKEALEAIPSIGVGNVEVSGGPGGVNPFIVTFQNRLGGQDVPQIVATPSLTGGTSPDVVVKTINNGVDASFEVMTIPPREVYHLQQALDRIRPVTVIPTVSEGQGLLSPQVPRGDFVDSEFTQVTRYVTGNPRVKWPTTEGFWIRPSIEIEAPRIPGEISQHYQGFHDLVSIISYTESALSDPSYETDVASTTPYTSMHLGAFNSAQTRAFPVLDGFSDGDRFSPDLAGANYPESPVMEANGLIQGIYPYEYTTLPGVPQIVYSPKRFWSSVERLSGTDYLEIDLGSPQAVNFVSFETIPKDFNVEVAVDLLDQGPRRHFLPVTPVADRFPSTVNGKPLAKWTHLEFDFTDLRGDIFYTRFIRIGFQRRDNPNKPFLVGRGAFQQTGMSDIWAEPWSVDVRNLRIGRNVSN